MQGYHQKYVIPGRSPKGKDHSLTFRHTGMISDAERDKVEAEMVSFIKSCSASVEHLSQTVAAMQEKRIIGQLDISEQALAHRHGMVRLERSVVAISSLPSPRQDLSHIYCHITMVLGAHCQRRVKRADTITGQVSL